MEHAVLRADVVQAMDDEGADVELGKRRIDA
jgi:hypothetical protein